MKVAKMLNRREFLNFSSRSAPVSDAHWVHVSRPVMACRFEVTLPLCDRAGVAAARDALSEAERQERRLTIFKADSAVSFLNRTAATRAMRVDDSLFALLRLCKELWLATGGAFDITSGPLSRCWGFLSRSGQLPAPEEIERAKSLVGSDKLLLDARAQTVRFERAGVEINLGSIGKGYALDRIASLLKGRMRSALLSAGSSSMRVIGAGDRGRRGWTVGVRHPRMKDRRLAVLTLRDCALGTSGAEEQFFELEGKRYGHIVDPRSGAPAQQVESVTVIAQSAAVADALATAFYVGGPGLAERYCATQPEVLVLMLEAGAERPEIFGSNDGCEVSMNRD